MIPNDERPIAVYSGLWLIARAFSVSPREVPRVVIEALLDAAGPSRTIVMPTYTGGFKDGLINLDLEPSQTGVITEAFRLRPEARRTASAFFSFAAVGPEAEALATLRPIDAWGDGSVFEWLETSDAHIVVLGESWDVVSLKHRAEWLSRVPYRYRKEFSGEMISLGRRETLRERLYVRSLNPNVTNIWHGLDSLLLSAGMKTSPLGAGQFAVMSARSLIQCMKAELHKDPFCFSHDPREVRAWFS